MGESYGVISEPLKARESWKVMTCKLVEAYVHFGRKYCLHFKGRRISQASNMHMTALQFLIASHPSLALGLLFDPEEAAGSPD
jgi:hypothetical protein